MSALDLRKVEDTADNDSTKCIYRDAPLAKFSARKQANDES